MIAGLFPDSLQEGINRHGVTMTQFEIFFQPGNNIACLHGKLAVFKKSFFGSELLKVFRTFAGFCFYIIQVSLKRHMGSVYIFIKKLFVCFNTGSGNYFTCISSTPVQFSGMPSTI